MNPNDLNELNDAIEIVAEAVSALLAKPQPTSATSSGQCQTGTQSSTSS